MKNEPVPDVVSAIFDGLSLAPFDPFYYEAVPH